MQKKLEAGKSKVAALQTDGVRFNNFTYQSARLWLNGLKSWSKSRSVRKYRQYK